LLQLYHQENIYVVLVGIEVWTAGDNITVGSDGDKRLTDFCSYRENSINPIHNNDNAQLLTYDLLLLSGSEAGVTFRDFAIHQLGFLAALASFASSVWRLFLVCNCGASD